MGLNHKPLGASFGVEISGLDLGEAIGDAVKSQLRGVLDQHRLLLFRNQSLSAENQVDALAAFGRIYDDVGDGTQSTLLSEKPDRSLFAPLRLLFHHDFAFTPWPLEVLSLYGMEVAAEAAPTDYVDLETAFATLPAHLKSQVEGLSATHATTFENTNPTELARVRLHDLPPTADPAYYPRTTHPVVKPHPRTGRPLLFVNEHHTSHLNDLPPEAGEELLQALLRHIYRPEHRYSHRWRKGDLVIWDNVALQHGRAEISPTARRDLRRVAVNAKTVRELHVGLPDHLLPANRLKARTPLEPAD